MKKYDSFVERVGQLSDDDPARLGRRKTGRHHNSYGYNLTKSDRLIFRIDYTNKIIILVDIGDHKNVYGGD